MDINDNYKPRADDLLLGGTPGQIIRKDLQGDEGSSAANESSDAIEAETSAEEVISSPEVAKPEDVAMEDVPPSPEEIPRPEASGRSQKQAGQDESSCDSQATEEYFAKDIPMPELIPIPEELPLNEMPLDVMPELTPGPTVLDKHIDSAMPELFSNCDERLEESNSASELNEAIEKFLDSPQPEQEKDCDDDLLVEVPSPKEPPPKPEGKNFVDSLLDKLRRKNSDSSAGSDFAQRKKVFSESEDDLLVEVEAPVRYSKPTNPNLLPTPIVLNQRMQSIFVNTEAEYNQIASKHKHRQQTSQVDKGQMGSKSEPPKMKMPEMNIQKPRTLAEKRQLLSRPNTKFLMVEQESKIYRQVQRKNSKMDIHYSQVDAMMLEDIPTNPGPWKVLQWLRTREGNFIQQYIDVDGTNYKLNGSRGNHREKFLPSQSFEPLPKHQMTSLRSTRCCAGGRIKKRVIDSIIKQQSIRRFVLEESVDPHKLMDKKFLDHQLVSIKPRPLAKKIEFINQNRSLFNNDEDSAFLGDYAKFEMPDVSLEVAVQPRTPLNPVVKKYLKEILPHRDLNENWCEFALSALATKDPEKARATFQFAIPYQNNKRNILVRKIERAKEDNELLRIPPYVDGEDEAEDEMEWTFAKDADKDDPIECEVVEVIKDLTNSVFINLNDDLFTQDDPIDRKAMSISPTKMNESIGELSTSASPTKTKEAIGELSSIVKPDRSKRVLLELRRLNANVFKSESPCVEDVSCSTSAKFFILLTFF